MTKLNPESLKKKANAFISGADSHATRTALDPDAKPTKTFTVPMNDYEIDLLRQVAAKNDRSMRKESRRIIVNALLKDLELK